MAFPLFGQTSQFEPHLGPGFVLDTAGVLTVEPTEVIAGKQSIKGTYSGSSSYTPYLRTAPNVVALAPRRTYRATFHYRILAAPDKGFEVLFFSPSGGADNNFLPSYTVNGIAGTTGTATLTNTLGVYTDYQVRWNVVGRGAIAIDDIQIVDVATGTVVAAEDAEGTAPEIRLAQAFLPPAQVGRTFSVALAAWGGTPPYTWSTGIVPLPQGLQLAADGYLFGKPSAEGSYLFDSVVTDSTNASARVPLRLTMTSSPSLPPPEPLTITNGVATIRLPEYKLAFRNPLGGMRPYLDPAKSHPFASLGRQYIEWNLLENSASDTVDKIRAVTDRLFADLPSYNIKAIPRVYLIWPQPLAKYWPSDLTPDDYTSPNFRSRMKRLIARLGEVWNNDPRIAYIETGIIGYWGEQHDPWFASSGSNPSLPPEMETEFGDAFRNAFPGKLVMNRYPRNLLAYPFGTYWDAFGAFDGFVGNSTTAMTAELQTPSLIDRWKIAPRGGEIDPTFLGEPNFSEESLRNVVRKYTPRFVDIIQTLHWNHLDVLQSLNASDPDLWDKASQIQNALGYRFVIDETTYPPVVQPGQGLSLRLKIRNIGSSPFYYPWPLEVALLDAATRRPVWRSIWDGIDVRTWLPGGAVDIQRTFAIPSDLPAGQYVVSLAILDPSGMVPGARFAVVNYWMGGRTPLGPVSVAGPPPIFQLNEFDDLQTDRSLYYLPPTGNSARAFKIVNRGGLSLMTDGAGAQPASGYSRIQPSSGSTAPAGVAIFGGRTNGVLVSETGVPATPLLTTGRIYAEVAGAVNTGFTLVNPNNSSAAITFFYTDASGVDLGAGSTTIGPNSQLVKFLSESPFKTFNGSTFRGTFSFTSTAPVGVVALRTYTNEYGDFLMSTVPVIDTSTVPNTGTLVLPHFVDGGGWITQILLVNPTDAPMTGSLQFMNDNGATTNVTIGTQTSNMFSYSVPRRSSQKLATSGLAQLSSGSVRIVPNGNSTAPTPLIVFSYRPLGVVVSEAVVPAIRGTAFRMYAESSGTDGQPDNIQTGVAIANNGEASVRVTFELSNLDGSTTGLPPPVFVDVPALGHTAKFLAQIFTGLPNLFKGVLRISTPSASGISVVGLRSRYNERKTIENFLITTTPPALENASPTFGELLFPNLVNGGGYTTQFILFSGFAGQNSTGNLRFVRPDGTSYSLTLN